MAKQKSDIGSVTISPSGLAVDAVIGIILMQSSPARIMNSALTKKVTHRLVLKCNF